MISILAYLLSFKYTSYYIPPPSSLSSFLSAGVTHMIMTVIGVPPEHKQQGAEVVLGGDTCQNSGPGGVSLAYAVHVAWGGNP